MYTTRDFTSVLNVLVAAGSSFPSRFSLLWLRPVVIVVGKSDSCHRHLVEYLMVGNTSTLRLRESRFAFREAVMLAATS